MLVLSRKPGQWIEITHRSGDVLRIGLGELRSHPERAALAFQDDARNFEILREELGERRPPAAVAGRRPVG